MEIENRPSDNNRRSWIIYVLLLILVVGGLVAANIYDIKEQLSEQPSATSESYNALLSGDMLIKQALSHGIHTEAGRTTADQAVSSYDKAIPWPSAYRRIGVTKEAFLGESGAKDFSRINSRQATKGLSKANKRKLTSELEIWRNVYGPNKLTRQQADGYISRIRKLNLGPLKEVAIASAYTRSSRPLMASKILDEAKNTAKWSVAGSGALVGALFIAGLIGIFLIFHFLKHYAYEPTDTERTDIHSPSLFAGFFGYLIGFMLLSQIVGRIADVLGSSVSRGTDDIISLILNAVAMLGALGIGLSMLQSHSEYPWEMLRVIGYRTDSLKKAARWGIGGYCAALPVITGLTYLTQAILSRFFPRLQTPTHPLVPEISQGGIVFIVGFIVAAVIAPIVEETGFRGMLYNALRGKMGVWPAALLSGAIFALVHPTLPGEFLPIWGLGVVLALLREKTGSLLPGMICHGINNAVALIGVLLQF